MRPAQFRRAPSSAPSGLGSRDGPGLGVGLATGGSGAGCSGDKVKGAEECKDGSTTAAAGGAAGAASDAAAAAASGGKDAVIEKYVGRGEGWLRARVNLTNHRSTPRKYARRDPSWLRLL